MGCTVFDYMTLRSQFSTYEMRKVWEEENLLQDWLRVEAAVAKVQGSMGIIPQDAAEEICDKAKTEFVRGARVGEKIKKSGHLIVGLIQAFQEVLDPNGAEYVHYGISSADILDTGLVLAVRDSYRIVERDLRELIQIGIELASKHKETVIAGRTHGQHANPVTFGFKVAIWLNELDRHLERLRECEKRVLVGNLSGAVGMHVGLGHQGKEFQSRVLAELGLGEPVVVSHMLQRDRFAELTHILASLGTTLGKIGHEVFTLQRPEIGELEEPFEAGSQVGSSSMPHKRNPFRSEATWGMARLLRALSLSVTESQVMENENDISMLSSTYISVPLCCMFISRLLHDLKFVMKNLRVNAERMKSNLAITKGLNCSEEIMMRLARKIGRKSAHRMVYELSMECYRSGKTFEEVLLGSEEIRKTLTAGEIREAVDAATNGRAAARIVESVIQESEKIIGKR